MSDDLALALELAGRADAITMRHFRSLDLRVETKPDLTPVSVADREVEEALRAAVADARPHDAVLGEEFGASGESARRWILDPIDGTKNYVRGIAVFATLIALEDEQGLAVAAVSAPALGRRWWATRGGGAFADGAPIHVSRIARLADAVVSTAQPETFAFACWHARAFGDFWQHMLVAEGSCDVALDPVVSLWDLAPVQLIVEEAGGRFTDLAGVARVDGGSGLSTNGLLHEEALAAFAG